MSLPWVGWDYETRLLTPKDQRPEPVCVSFAGDADSYWLRDAIKIAADGDYFEWAGGEYLDSKCQLQEGEWCLVCPPHTSSVVECHINDVLWWAHNAPFESGVLCTRVLKDLSLLPSLVETGNLRDTKIREMLLCIANDWMDYDPRTRRKDPHFSLAELVLAHFKVDISDSKKEGSPRTRFAEMIGRRIPDYPYEFLAYSGSDSVWTKRVARSQQRSPSTMTSVGTILQDDCTFINEIPQRLTDECFGITEMSGPRLDPIRVEKYAQGVRELAAIAQRAARAGGWVKLTGCRPCEGTGKIGDAPDLRDCELCHGGTLEVRPKPKSWSKTKRSRLLQWITHAYNGDPPRTKKGAVKYDTETLEFSKHPLLLEYAKGTRAQTALDRQVPLLQQGARDGVISARFNVLLKTGRTSCRKPNLQNPDSKGLYRSCFVSRPGHVFRAIDYSTIELYSWAQNCRELLGYSTMGEVLNQDRDVHSGLGVDILSMFWNMETTYEEFYAQRKQGVFKEARSFAKVPNFGCPGMLTKPASLVSYAAGLGVEITLMQGEQLINLWKTKWAESSEWIAYFKRICPWGATFAMRQPVSGRVRGGCYSSSGANSYFQGRAADFAKAAYWLLTRAMIADENSPLFGCRIWNFVHDEFIIEGPQETSHLWGPEAERLMLLPKERFFPDYHHCMKVESDVSVRWYKGAGLLQDDRGRDIPWEFKDRDAVAQLPVDWLAAAPDYFYDFLEAA